MEPALILVTVGLLWWLDFDWPTRLPAGELVLTLACIALLQTLLRDLYLWRKQRAVRGSSASETTACFCLESTVGLSAVVVGACLLLATPVLTVEMSAAGWVASLAAVMFAGFLLNKITISCQLIYMRIVRCIC